MHLSYYTWFVSCVSSNSIFTTSGFSQSSTANNAGACTCMQDILPYVERQKTTIYRSWARHYSDNVHRTSASAKVDQKQQLEWSSNRCRDWQNERVCKHADILKRGFWHGVTDNDTSNTAINEFTQVSSLLEFNTQEGPSVFGTDVYSDASGLGSIFMLSATVYAFNGRRVVAVVPVDNLFTEVIYTMIDRDPR